MSQVYNPLKGLMPGITNRDGDTEAELPEEFVEQIDKFKEMMLLYNCAIREVNTKLENLDSEMEVRGERNPIQYITHRIKTPASIIKKMKRNNLELTFENIWNNLSDVAGIRVVCAYIEDIYAIADMLLAQDDVVLVKRKDYIDAPKPSGYRSLHLVIETPVYLSDKKYMVRVEIQIRTIAMDFWASLEHQLRYKTKLGVPESITNDLTKIADVMYETDLKMAEIAGRIRNVTQIAEAYGVDGKTVKMETDTNIYDPETDGEWRGRVTKA